MNTDDPRREPGDEHQPQKLHGPFADLNLRDEAAEKRFIESVKATGIPIVSDPLDTLGIKAHWDFRPPSAQQGQPPTAHELLSAAVYGLARKIEARNMAQDTVILEEDANFLEELIVDIATMPLSADIAMRLAFEKPPKPGDTDA